MTQLFDAEPTLAFDALATPRFNIRPTEGIAVCARIGGARRLTSMRWGFLGARRGGAERAAPLINARAETVAEKPTFRDAIRETRCLAPATGFYEWRADAGPGAEPHWIAPASGAPIAFAGVWRESLDAEGAPVRSLAIISCAADPSMAWLHHRLPVVIQPADFGVWLGEEGKGAARLMRPPPEGFYRTHPVSRRVNAGGRNAVDDASLIAPIDSAAEAAARPVSDRDRRQASLF